jgi:hypothetical protein
LVAWRDASNEYSARAVSAEYCAHRAQTYVHHQVSSLRSNRRRSPTDATLGSTEKEQRNGTNDRTARSGHEGRDAHGIATVTKLDDTNVSLTLTDGRTKRGPRSAVEQSSTPRRRSP